MKYKVLYSPQYDCLMLALPIFKGSHWYKFEGDPWSYGGACAHKLDFLFNVANFILIDELEFNYMLKDLSDYIHKDV